MSTLKVLFGKEVTQTVRDGTIKSYLIKPKTLCNPFRLFLKRDNIKTYK